MKKFFLAGFVLLNVIAANAQVDTTIRTEPSAVKKAARNNIDLSNRAGDHFLIQFGYDGWANKPDSIHTKGFSRSFAMYLMFDFPFKTNPHFSVAVGAGVSSSNIYFDKMEVQVAGQTPTLRFVNQADTSHWKKFKMTGAYLEAPVELRFASDPYNYNKTFKFALGVKIGTLLSVHTKAKNFQTRTEAAINNYIRKESSKRYFNSTRLAVTGRVGLGFLSLFGSYQVNSFIKDGAGPDIKPYTIGLTLSGL